MLKGGILNAHLLSVLGECGHTDWLMLSDAGMPIPLDKERVDLAIINDLPRQLIVLKAILEQIQIEKIFIAEEIKDVSPIYLKKVQKLLSEFDLQPDFIPHEELKGKSQAPQTRACIRTGERTSYSTMILQVGVPYGGDDTTNFEI
ncbi:MAG TPA: D-ribose pyranase [Clostridiaceae bacterium]|nr:D-ribose pyranase [Clostridiaceae bacterium]